MGEEVFESRMEPHFVLYTQKNAFVIFNGHRSLMMYKAALAKYNFVFTRLQKPSSNNKLVLLFLFYFKGKYRGWQDTKRLEDFHFQMCLGLKKTT
ncbi:unnamed protein product [Larinioides sclopetarius]|uniref:Uncharacterized protein n=1 Tax=Larinioides sclopetarius TaxID=280406 RepID=A0AAV2A8R7_9ARAC